MTKPIYLDYNATTPVDAEVFSEMKPYFTEYFGNPASGIHVLGECAHEAVSKAKERISHLIGAHPGEIQITSGATEAINQVLKGLFDNPGGGKNHIITQASEHKAVVSTCEYLESKGAEVTYLRVDSKGKIDLKELEDSITDRTLVIAIMWSNNETGVVQPILDISKIARKYGVPLLCDATQVVGKIPIDVRHIAVDYLVFSSHKIYGPKGIGALYIRGGKSTIPPLIHGGGSEPRSGTENVHGIVGFGKACEISERRMHEDFQRISTLKRCFVKGIRSISGCVFNVDPEETFFNVVNVSFGGIDPAKFMEDLRTDLCFSTGSACTTRKQTPSHVLEAMGVPENRLRSSFRFSFGRQTTHDEIDRSIELLKSVVTSMYFGRP